MPALRRCALRSLQFDVMAFCDGALHVHDQCLDVGGTRGAVVDDEIGVLLRHRRIADAKALEIPTLRSAGRHDRPGGFVNTEPQLHSPIGCDCLRRSSSSRIAASLTPGLRSNSMRAAMNHSFRPGHAPGGSRCRSRPARVCALTPRRSITSTSITWRQVSPSHAPAFIASAPPNVPGMPAKNSAGPRPHFTHCRASRAHGTPACALDARCADALDRAQRAVHRHHRAAHAAVAHQEVAAEPDPQQRHGRGQLAQETRTNP